MRLSCAETTAVRSVVASPVGVGGAFGLRADPCFLADPRSAADCDAQLGGLSAMVREQWGCDDGSSRCVRLIIVGAFLSDAVYMISSNEDVHSKTNARTEAASFFCEVELVKYAAMPP